jgi:hypothetical protein
VEETVSIRLAFDATRIAFHPRRTDVLVRLDTREKGLIVWRGGYKPFAISDMPTSWQVLKDDDGNQLPIRIRRVSLMLIPGAAVDVDFK